MQRPKGSGAPRTPDEASRCQRAEIADGKLQMSNIKLSPNIYSALCILHFAMAATNVKSAGIRKSYVLCSAFCILRSRERLPRAYAIRPYLMRSREVTP